MKALLIISSFCLISLPAFASNGGLAFVCASQNNDFKITADLSDTLGDRVAAVVDEGAKSIYAETVNKKKKLFFKVDWRPQAKTLIAIRSIHQKSNLVTLTTDPTNNHSVLTINDEEVSPTKTNPNHKTVFKQTKLDAILTVPGQEISEQPVSCLITKWNE